VDCTWWGMRPAVATRCTLRRRKRLRAPWWDYQGPGAYFVTVCTWRRRRILSRIVDGHVVLTAEGRCASEVWSAIPAHYRGISLDAHVVMPDHIHGILILQGAGVTVGQVVNLFKGATTTRIGRLWAVSRPRVWQRGFHDRIIRDDAALESARRYIDANPWRWTG